MKDFENPTDQEKMLIHARTIEVFEGWSEETRTRRQFAWVDRAEDSGLYVPPLRAIELWQSWSPPLSRVEVGKKPLLDSDLTDSTYWMHDNR